MNVTILKAKGSDSVMVCDSVATAGRMMNTIFDSSFGKGQWDAESSTNGEEITTVVRRKGGHPSRTFLIQKLEVCT